MVNGHAILGDSAVNLQKNLRLLESYCEQNFLEANADQTKIVHFYNHRSKSMYFFQYQDKEIETLKKYCFLNMHNREPPYLLQTLTQSWQKKKSQPWDKKYTLLATVFKSTIL